MKTAVILICYNQEDYIYDALEGLRTQKIAPDEVVIADDYSTDKTQDIILDYVKTYKLDNWILSFNQENLGINLNLQHGIDQTTSDIIIIMSGDDISLPNRVEVTLFLFKQHPDLHVIGTSNIKIDEHKNVIGELVYDDTLNNDVYKVIVAGMPNVFPVGQSMKRSVFDKFGKLPGSVPNEDDQITFRAMIDGGIYCSSIKTVLYRVHSRSESSWLRNNQSEKEFFDRFTRDMIVRKTHMELWEEALNHVERPDKDELIELIRLKISLYNLFNKLDGTHVFERLKYLSTHKKATGLRERYYIALGKFGVLSWRRLKLLLGR